MSNYKPIAIIGYGCINHIIKNDWFLKGDGYLGYGALFLMAVASMILRHPFAGYYIEKEKLDVPAEKIAQVSYIFSFIWMIVFFVSTVIFYWIKVPVQAILFSNFFVVLGIFISIWLVTMRADN